MTDDKKRIERLERELKKLQEQIEKMQKMHALEHEYINDDIKHLYRLHGL